MTQDHKDVADVPLEWMPVGYDAAEPADAPDDEIAEDEVMEDAEAAEMHAMGMAEDGPDADAQDVAVSDEEDIGCPGVLTELELTELWTGIDVADDEVVLGREFSG